MVVAIGTESFATAPPPVVNPTVTWGSVPLSPLRREDGTEAAFTILSSATFSRMGIHFFALREAQFAGLLSTTLEARWDGVAGLIWNFQAAYWLLSDCDQAPIIRDFRTFSTNSGGLTSLGGSTNPGGAADAVLVAGINNGSAGSIQITIDGVGITEDFDNSFATASARFAGGKDMTAAAVPGIPFSMAYTLPANQGAIITGVRLAEHFPPDGQSAITQGPASLVTLDAL